MSDIRTSRLSPSQWFGRRLAEIRKRRRLTQAELGDVAGMTRAAVLGVENGTRGLSLDEAVALAYSLRVAPAHLMSPPAGEHVWLTESVGVTGSELRVFLDFGDPLALLEGGETQTRLRKKSVDKITVYARALIDATDGDDVAGYEAAKAGLVKAVYATVKNTAPGPGIAVEKDKLRRGQVEAARVMAARYGVDLVLSDDASFEEIREAMKTVGEAIGRDNIKESDDAS